MIMTFEKTPRSQTVDQNTKRLFSKNRNGQTNTKSVNWGATELKKSLSGY